MKYVLLWIGLLILVGCLPVVAFLVRFLIPVFAFVAIGMVIFSCFNSKVRHWLET